MSIRIELTVTPGASHGALEAFAAELGPAGELVRPLPVRELVGHLLAAAGNLVAVHLMDNPLAGIDLPFDEADGAPISPGFGTVQ